MLTINRKDFEIMKFLGKRRQFKEVFEFYKKLGCNSKGSLSKKIKQLESTGMINSEKEGRNKFIKISQTGSYFVKHLKKLK